MNDAIQDLLARVPSSKGTGKYLDKLTAESREVLAVFETWLVDDDGKTETTARAYKGYVAQALVMIEEDPTVELSTDVKSAINALRRFKEAGVTAAGPAHFAEDEDSEA